MHACIHPVSGDVELEGPSGPGPRLVPCARAPPSTARRRRGTARESEGEEGEGEGGDRASGDQAEVMEGMGAEERGSVATPYWKN